MTLKIEFSNSDLIFEYIGFSVNQYPEYMSFIISAENYAFDDVEKTFSGNDEIILKTLDENNEVIGKSTFKNWTVVRSIRKEYNYVLSVDEEGNETTTTVYVAEVEKADITGRVTSLESEVSNISNSDITDLQVAVAELYEAMNS